MDKFARGSYLMTHITLLNGRYFNKLLSKTEAVYSGEQGKILTTLRDFGDDLTASEISKYSGLANNTLTSLLKKLETMSLIRSVAHPTDGRKKLFSLTDFGREQVALGYEVSQEVGKNFYQGFKPQEIELFEKQLERILENIERVNKSKND
ncbi:MAG: MarR family transcriptional regulator [Streptococcus sp.]|uniref:MarR family winged helix-turn-helix transcriptional regulator n=1 Tax=Streptococcus sp. TaxID=1306 RepID=UPI00257D6592|nr:MarR family transcriptional regulator [Streptococcus sp.]MBS5219883.1 MarR family transcriptional regulator [Streptococcus sp.]